MPPTPRMRTRRLVTWVVASLVALAACTAGTPASESGKTPAGSPSTTTAAAATTSPGSAATGTATPSPTPVQTGPATTLLAGLEVAWSIALLPDGSALVSERNTGDVYHVPAPGSGGQPRVVGRLPIERTSGEGGLLGLAVAKDFGANPVFYAYYSTDSDNRIAAVPWGGDRIGEPKVIFQGIPRGQNHNGGRIKFGPDGYLYVGTGEAGDTSLSQNRQSLGGKILRITREGDAAPGNPFGGSPIWSYGHRNVQGLAWDSKGRMWASEFGASTWDELNLIEPGRNYGWPEVEGKAGNDNFVDPVAQWPTSDMSPSGIAIGPDGAVYMAALRGTSVWRVPIRADGSAGEPQRKLNGTYGRIRDVLFVGGRLWLTTSNGSNDRLISLPLSDVGAG